MYRLGLFLKKIFVPLMFIVIESLAVGHYMNSSDEAQARMMVVSESVTGAVNGKIADMREFLTLRTKNKELTGEIARLRNMLVAHGCVADSTGGFRSRMAVSEEIAPYYYTTARVVNNSISGQTNYFTIDRGLSDGVEADMGVLSPEGVVMGYVVACSNKYAVCMSILNRSFRTGGKIKGRDFTGSIQWNGQSPDFVMLHEMQKYAEIHKGDTIVTAGFSSFFPSDLTIGTVESFELENATYYEVKVRLAKPVSSLSDVILVKCQDAAERNALEQEVIGPR